VFLHRGFVFYITNLLLNAMNKTESGVDGHFIWFRQNCLSIDVLLIVVSSFNPALIISSNFLQKQNAGYGTPAYTK
jgi:uncharacterized membrane protein YhdT